MTIDVNSHAAEAAASARLWSYLQKAPDRTEAEELVARDSFMAGFKEALRWYSNAVETMGARRP